MTGHTFQTASHVPRRRHGCASQHTAQIRGNWRGV